MLVATQRHEGWLRSVFRSAGSASERERALDSQRKAYAELTMVGEAMPIYEVYNPAIAQVNAEHLFSVAMFDVMNNSMAPEQAIDKAFKRAEEIFAKYPIQQA